MRAPEAILLVREETGYRWHLYDKNPDTDIPPIASQLVSVDGFDAEQAISQALAVMASYRSSKSAFQ